MQDILDYKVHDKHVAVITLNRPRQANAMNKALSKAYREAYERTQRDPAIRAVILASSSDRVFCAGADLQEMQALREAGQDAAPEFDLNRWERTKPWIASVGGPAIAGGFEMVLGCDIIVATPNAKFSMPEVKLGLPAGAGALHRLTRFIPHNKALQFLLTGDFMSAEAAHRYGLVCELVEPSDLLDTALGLASKIAANAPLAVKASLEIARRAYDLSEDELYEQSDASFNALFETDDAKEGARAFVEKRAPVWQGK